MIDNYKQAKALTEKMKGSLPFTVYPDQGLWEIAKSQGDSLTLNQELTVIEVMYGGDDGGIMCVLESRPEQKRNYVSSVTHLRIPPQHPLANEIRAYQKKRTVSLAVADGKLGKARRLAKKMSKKKGFGG